MNSQFKVTEIAPENERAFYLSTIVGEVIDIQSTSSTSLSSSGGYADARNGIYVPPTVSSSTTQIETIFVRSEAGEEIDFQLYDKPLALRTGNRVSLVIMKEDLKDQTLDGKPEGRCIVGLVNHDTSKYATVGSNDKVLTPFSLQLAKHRDFIFMYFGGIAACSLLFYSFPDDQKWKEFMAWAGGIFAFMAGWIPSILFVSRHHRSAAKRFGEFRATFIDDVVKKGLPPQGEGSAYAA
ncbi:hypothetical protein [Marinobacter salicampi]|uniref:hypothetical protein n=1 Tax=Marinobacter salicampi TaxID=435907 RepID=UPI00140E2BAF|nr:hypothetical protein [Marinobacter salicampi]